MYYGIALLLFVTNIASYYIGMRYGKAFVARVAFYELEAASFEKTVGAVYQRVKLAIEKHL